MPRPYVLLSVAQSLDGYIDDTTSQRLVLSSPEDLDRVDEVRAGCDAIMIGATTLRRDNPRLRVKSAERRAARAARGLPPELLRVIVTRTGKISRDLRIWTADGDKIIYCPDAIAPGLRSVLGDLAIVAALGPEVDLSVMLGDLGARGVKRLMVEGGEQVHTQFLAADLADELHVTIGGFFVADPAAPRFVTQGVRLPQNAARRMRLAEVSRAGETAVLRYLRALCGWSRVPTYVAPRQVTGPAGDEGAERLDGAGPGREQIRNSYVADCRRSVRDAWPVYASPGDPRPGCVPLVSGGGDGSTRAGPHPPAGVRGHGAVLPGAGGAEPTGAGQGDQQVRVAGAGDRAGVHPAGVDGVHPPSQAGGHRPGLSWAAAMRAGDARMRAGAILAWPGVFLPRRCTRALSPHTALSGLV
ncbi:MAG TPA: dihydrofolate reductase family protein [Streptosporangiaceae bacterium]|nr:dihydrofolate reductase family protein [Streptosporangiaceae bacterium]